MSARTRSVRWADGFARSNVPISLQDRRAHNEFAHGGTNLRRRPATTSGPKPVRFLSSRLGLCAGLVLALAGGVLVGRLSMMGARSTHATLAADMSGWHSEGLAVAAVVVVALILIAGRGFEAVAAPGQREPSNVRPADLSQLSHELRTPLNAIIGFSEVMQHGMLGPIGHPRYEEYVRHISDNGHELKRGIEQVLADAEAVARRSHARMH